MWLYLNSFASSSYELYFEDVNSITFNTPTQFLYTYHGQNYTNYLGNYWSGKLDEFRDDNHDGVTDVPTVYTGGTINRHGHYRPFGRMVFVFGAWKRALAFFKIYMD